MSNTSAIQNNVSEGNGGGIYNVAYLSVSNSTIKDNTSQGNGGGIYGATYVEASLLKDNTASGSGGAVWDGGIISENCFFGNSNYSVDSSSTMGAIKSWWGAADGPSGYGPGSGDSIGPNVITLNDFITTAPANPDTDCLLGFPDPTPTPSPSPTPTYAPSTSLDLTGQHSGLKAVIFWATFRESNLDAVDSGSSADNDLGNPRLSSFLFTSPYCSPSSGAGDNAAEPPPPVNPSQDWYIRHCPEDYRYMAAQTMFNGFLNYERRFGISRVFEYANVNFSGSIGDTGLGLWSLDPQCITTIGSTYSVAHAASSPGNNYAPAISWLDSYMNCIGTSTSNDYRVLRAKRAYTTTTLPQINDAVVDFYATPQDYTDAAFQVKVINFGATRTLVACVGGCYINNDFNTVVYTYESPEDVFGDFATSLVNITQTHVDDAYDIHMQQIGTYTGDYHSVAQPVLITAYDTTTGQQTGYVWETEIYQQAADMSHYPR